MVASIRLVSTLSQVVLKIQLSVTGLAFSAIFDLSSGNLLLSCVTPLDVNHLHDDQNLRHTESPE